MCKYLSNNMKTKLALIIATICFSTVAFAQNRTIKGIILDAESGTPVVGAAVISLGNNAGVVSNLDGEFVLSVSNDTHELYISCLGYKESSVSLQNTNNLGAIQLQPEEYKLQDVIVNGQIAVNRKTPVVSSSVKAIEIEEKLGNQEFIEALKYTPGIHVNVQGGGWGDSEIFMRGFDNTNIAVLVNGVQVNDLETGTMYWSDWASLNDVTAVMQTQRGIGASKISTSSVGGTVNIITKGIQPVAGGSVSYALGNDGYSKMMFAANTGLMNGWALSLSGSYARGDGYVQGTDFKVYNYFMNLSKRFGDNHQLSLTAFGAFHKQHGRYNALTTAEWNKVKESITKPIEKAKETVKGILDKIKGFFPISIGNIMSHIKLPHFKWHTKDVLGKIKIPVFDGIDWYDKGGIFNDPAVIGVGEKRPEFVGALDDLRKIVREESRGRTAVNQLNE